MRLHILEGPAGSGKTAQLLETVRRRSGEGKPVNPLPDGGEQAVSTWFVVPDQATFLMEKRILDTLGDRGGAAVRVFSLSRLARHVLSLTGGTERTFLDATGKGVLVYRVVRALADRLPLFSDAIRKGGFSSAAAELISECRRYGVEPAQLREAAERTSDARLAVKLRELAEMAEAVRAAMDEGGYRDGEDLLLQASRHVRELPDVGRIHLCVDQFQRLSPMQAQLVGACLAHMASVTVTLRLREENAPTEALAHAGPGRTVRQIRESLLEMAERMGATVSRACTAQANLRHPPGSGLAHLAAQLSSFQPDRYPKKPDDIHVAVFATPEEEIHACAERLLTLRRDGGCRFRDLAVLLPDDQAYAASVRRIFRLHDIPLFMDRKESLAGHPVSVALLAVFDILRGGWRHEDVFRLIKTGLLPISDPTADCLENYALATGMRGRRLWQVPILADEALEQARQALVQPLVAFRQAFHGKVEAKTGLEAFVNLLLSWRLPQAVSRLARQLAARGDLASSGHMRQIWQSACNLMDQILNLGSEEPLTLTDLHGMLQSGLEGGTTSIIPPSLEEVFVGTPSRSQLAQVRHLFVLGVVEGWIPAQPGGQGILSDSDRRRLRECGLTLAPDTREAGQERRDELDTVLSMPSHGLWLSRPVSDMEGKALLPSSLLSELTHLFPGLREGWTSMEGDACLPEVSMATTPRALLERLAPTLGETGMPDTGRSVRLALLQACQDYPELERPLRSLQAGLSWQNRAVLDPRWMQARFGQQLVGSISALEQYRRCPFSWFARHVASLRERDEAGLQDVGFGLLLHDVLDTLAEDILALGGWHAVEEDALEALVSKAATGALRKGTGISPLHPGLSSWFASRMTKAALLAVRQIYGQIRDSQFTPVGYELEFSDKGPFPPFGVDLGNGRHLSLRGRLDRLDVHETPQGRYVRVVDYKSGDRGLSLADIANGMSMQLPAYLTVALASLEASASQAAPPRPAGIFHMRLEPPEIRVKSDAAQADPVAYAQEQRGLWMQLTGYMLDDPAILSAMDAHLPHGGTSRIVKAGLNKDGTISSRTRTLSERGFRQLGERLRQCLAQLGNRLLDGDIPVCPVRVGNMKACSHCPYAPVCRFEPGLGGASWERPARMAEQEIRNRLEQEEADEVDR